MRLLKNVQQNKIGDAFFSWRHPPEPPYDCFYWRHPQTSLGLLLLEVSPTPPSWDFFYCRYPPHPPHGIAFTAGIPYTPYYGIAFTGGIPQTP